MTMNISFPDIFGCGYTQEEVYFHQGFKWSESMVKMKSNWLMSTQITLCKELWQVLHDIFSHRITESSIFFAHNIPRGTYYFLCIVLTL